MSTLRNYWDTILALVVASCVAYWAEPDLLDDISTEIITFFSIQSATVLPAMIFAAGILRPDGGTIEQIKKYKKAIRTQMTFWVVLLSLDFATVLVMILGKGLSWSGQLATPFIDNYTLDLSWTLSSCATFLVILTGLRTIPLVKGILSLFELYSTMTEKVALDRYAETARRIKESENDIPAQKPEEFGRISSHH